MSHRGNWKKAPVSFGLNLRSARALSEVGGINKNVSNGWQGKKLRLWPKKVSVLPSCIQVFDLRPLLLPTSFAGHRCPHARLGLCKCLVQRSTADSLYHGRVTDPPDRWGFRRLPEPLLSLLHPWAKGNLPGRLLPAFLLLWNNMMKLLWVCGSPSKLQARAVIIITEHHL